MKCIHVEKRCPFRAYKDGLAFCRWHCPHDYPPSDCSVANEAWGCPYVCIYEALEGECPFKHELERTLGKMTRRHEEISLKHIPPHDREWIARERCPLCGGKPVILSYSSGEWGCSVEFQCSRCGFRWGADEG